MERDNLYKVSEEVPYIQSAEKYEAKGNLDLAETEIKKALDIAKLSPYALRVSAKICRMRFESTKDKKYLNLAQAEIEKSLAIMSKDPWANCEAALIYYDQNDKAKASQAIAAALKAEPRDEYLLSIKAKVDSMQ